MAAARGQFNSRIGFILAAAGSAVGLGNIWGFPTQAASNGGAAFLIVYLVLAFCLAYPALMAELIIGRHAHANASKALEKIAPNRPTALLGHGVGLAGLIVASLILSFYAIVAGWMIGFGLAALLKLVGFGDAALWLESFSTARNMSLMAVFMILTISIITQGVHGGIERWSERLMPLLLVSLVGLTVYVLTLPGASEGLRVYLLPDFNKAISPDLVIKALGAAFFSLSLGVGTMLIYGSYISDEEHLPSLGGWVTLSDVSIAVLAGFLVLPAMYVAQHNGISIFTESGTLLSEDTLIFTVLPALFDTMGSAGTIVALAFFFLMSIAALTSSISMLEVPVAYTVENTALPRPAVTWTVGAVISAVSVVIILNFDWLFGAVITITTRYSQPLLGFMFCIYAGWLWYRNDLLNELKKNNPNAAQGLFWKIWPNYVKVVCPLIILGIFYQSL
jgi:NSS family neurotransmitter:Na+ symporter